MENRKIILLHLLHVCVLAALLRVLYLILAQMNLGDEGLLTSIPDTNTYLAVADQILVGGNALGKEFLFWIGPGYGLIVAGIKYLFGSNQYVLYGFNMLMGTLSAGIIYLLAYHLTDSRAVGFIAGLIAAISPTSLALSCNVLSDQPYFAFHAAALLCYTVALKKMKIRWFVWAGLLAGCAAWIRALGQIWWLAYLVVPLMLVKRDAMFKGIWFSRRRFMKRTLITAGLAALMIYGWAARNYAVEGVFIFGGNGAVAARWFIGARAIGDNVDGVTIFDVHDRWIQEDQVYYGGRQFTPAQKYYHFRDEFLRLASTYPVLVARAFWSNVLENMRGGNYIIRSQISVFRMFWWHLVVATENWIGYLIAALAGCGLLLLLTERRYYAAMLLGFTFMYFTLVIGFSLWQGSRLHYPAEMAWSILIAYVIVRLARLLGWLGGHGRDLLISAAGDVRQKLRN